MKVCIIGHTERNYLPYIDRYMDFFKENGVDYDVIYWQRERKKAVNAPNEYNYFEEAKPGTVNKILSYLRFKKYVLGILKKNHYDKIMVLTTVPAVFLYGYLTKHYKNRYLLDIRDYSFEKLSPYKKLVDKLIDSSELTTISSKGFMEFLAENKKIILNHNLPVMLEKTLPQDIKAKAVINLGFVGAVRYFSENVHFIEKLKNNSRFKLFYIGKEQEGCDLNGYCAANNVNNVSFIGKYDNSQKAELYQKIDIINSVYGASSLEVTTLLPNRLYEACWLKKPIIASTGTFLGEIVSSYKLGILVDAQKDDIAAAIEEYIASFNEQEFITSCDCFLAEVSKDEETLYAALHKYIGK